MTLKEYCLSLKKDDLFELAIKMCENALPIWDKYSTTNKLEYTDSVVGMHHTVRNELLHDSIIYCHDISVQKFFGKEKLTNLLDEFSDPVIAIQDSDWELPYPVEHTFHAVYNLLESIQKPITIFKEPALYVSINQAGDALQESNSMNLTEIKKLIYGDTND